MGNAVQSLLIRPRVYPWKRFRLLGCSKNDSSEISYLSPLPFSLSYWGKLCIRKDIGFSNARSVFDTLLPQRDE